MGSAGYARYIDGENVLEVVRPGENTTRKIRCTNLNPSANRVFGVEIHGNEIWVVVGPLSNQRPNRKYVYLFSSLSGGASSSL